MQLDLLAFKKKFPCDKSQAIFIVGLGISLSTDPFGLDGAR